MSGVSTTLSMSIIERRRSHLLSSIAFSTIFQCASWVYSQMESQPQSKRENAHWEPDEELAFLDYLVAHRADVERGGFRATHMVGAMDSIAHLHKRGKRKDKGNAVTKWQTVCFFLFFFVIALITRD